MLRRDREGSGNKVEPGRIISLLVVLDKYASEFVWLLELLRACKCEDAMNPDGSLDDRIKMLQDRIASFRGIYETCERMDMPLSVIQCERVIRAIQFALSQEEDGLQIELLKGLPALVENLSERVRDELGSKDFYFVNPGLSKFYDVNQFSEKAIHRLPRATYDMEEAGKCYALGRSTACAFHSIRVAEHGIKLILSHYSLTVRGSNREWGILLQTIKDHIPNIPDADEKQYLQGVVDRLDSLRFVWRNPTMHCELDYQPEQAKMILDDVIRLLDAICSIK